MFKALTSALALLLPIEATAVEQPTYTVVAAYPTFEVRDYGATLQARTRVSGPDASSRSAGFRALAGYIFGGNQESEKVAMTAPVLQGPGDAGAWEVRFVMPSAHTLDTLPTPTGTGVEVTEVPAQRVAVVRFSGVAGQRTMLDAERALRDAAGEAGLEVTGDALWAWYNPPWTPGFLRRNEVLLPVRDGSR